MVVDGSCLYIVNRDIESMLAFYLISVICLVNVTSLQGVQILSPWITELMKQRFDGVGPEGGE